MTRTTPISAPMCGDLPDDQQVVLRYDASDLDMGDGQRNCSCVSSPHAHAGWSRNCPCDLAWLRSVHTAWVGHKATPVRRIDQGDCEAVPLAWYFVGRDKCLEGRTAWLPQLLVTYVWGGECLGSGLQAALHSTVSTTIVRLKGGFEVSCS